MNETIKNVVAGILAGAVAAIAVVALVPEKEASLPEDFDITQYIDVESLKGEQGERGFTGVRGNSPVAGVDYTIPSSGKDGKDGSDGESVTVDEVIAALDEKDEADDAEYNGANGGFYYNLNLEDGVYEVKSTHFGSGYFAISIGDEDSNVVTLVDTEGHYSATTTFEVIDDEDYKLYVSGSGDWTVTFNEE